MTQNLRVALFSASVLFAAPLTLLAQVGGNPTSPSSSPSSAVPIEVTVPRVDTVDRVVAVVGNTAITWSDLAASLFRKQAQAAQQGIKLAVDSPFVRQTLDELVDEEVLVQKAPDVGVKVDEKDVAAAVDKQVKEIRSHFKSDAEYKDELKDEGFGTPDAYRRSIAEQIRRGMLQQDVVRTISKTAKPGSVSEEEVTKAFNSLKDQLAGRPPTVAFRQIVVAPRPSKTADSLARAKAESLLVQLRAGANFDEMAKRESMDPGSAKMGGDLGWQRRGLFVPEFEAVMFSLPPGQLSSVVKTTFGYHIIRVDHVRPAEVQARHILIAAPIDSNDVHVAQLRADTVAQKWRAGANFDSLVAKYHDPVEIKGVLEPDTIGIFPKAYQAVLADTKVGQISAPFALPSDHGPTKYAVVLVIARTEKGEYSATDVRENIRRRLSYERQVRTMLDELRKQTYVSLRM